VLRILVTLLLLHCVVAPQVFADDARFGLSVGPALWFELGDGQCEHDSDTVSCMGVFEDAFAGVRTRFDLELLRWLRAGVQLGFGSKLGGTLREDSGGLRETERHWFLPLGVHAYAHFERGRRVSLWLGPELFYTLRIDRVARRESRFDSQVIARDTRSGVAFGLALGVDVRLAGRVWLGFELAEALAFAEQERLPRRVTSRDPNALTRTGVLVRFVL
jgi:hypothetical protein